MFWVVLCALPLGGAVAARMLSRRWQAWVTWVLASIIAILVLASTRLSFNWAAGIVAALSGFGFYAPEFVRGSRGAVQNTVQQYLVGMILLGIGAFLFFTGRWSLLVWLAVVYFVLRYIRRRLNRSRQRARR